MTLNHAEIEGCVPHAGTMCLLDAVLEWDATDIACAAAAPCASHPLARDGLVPAVAAAEYAAQATAVHGALLGDEAVRRAGMLAKLSDVELHTACFPSNGGPLTVRAELLSRGASGCMYAFEVIDSQQPIASGRLIVAFTLSSAR